MEQAARGRKARWVLLRPQSWEHFLPKKKKLGTDAFVDDDSLSGDEEEDVEKGITEENNIDDLSGSAVLIGSDNRLSLPSSPAARPGIFEQMERASMRRFKTK